MYDTTPGTADIPSAWLDEGSTGTSGTLYAGKADPPPPPPVDTSIINGTNGDDTLQGSTGDNKLYGGKGDDTAVYRGVLDDYELSFDASSWQYKLVDKVSGRDGSDLLHNIERLQFDGLAVLLDGKGGATLEDGTQLLAPYVPPPPPEGDLIPEFGTFPIADELIGMDIPYPEQTGDDWLCYAFGSTTVEMVGITAIEPAFVLADA